MERTQQDRRRDAAGLGVPVCHGLRASALPGVPSRQSRPHATACPICPTSSPHSPHAKLPALANGISSSKKGLGCPFPNLPQPRCFPETRAIRSRQSLSSFPGCNFST